MRKVLMVAAMLIAPALAQPAEAGDRGSRHFTPHPGAKMYAPPPGRGFHGGDFPSRRHVQPHHFGSSRGGFVRFHDGRFGFGAIERFKPPHFQFRPPHHRGPIFGFGHRPRVHAWQFAPRHPGFWHGPWHRHR